MTRFRALLEGSWVVISRVISRVTMIKPIRVLITPLRTTHEPPTRVLGFRVWGFGFWG